MKYLKPTDKVGIHWVSSDAPDLDEEKYSELRTSIKLAGKIRVPILMYDGKIADGRHRWKIANELGIKCPYEDVTGIGLVELLKRVAESNKMLGGRNWTTGQKTLCAYNFIARASKNGKVPHGLIKEVSIATGVRREYLTKMKKIYKFAKNLVPKIRSGEKSLDGAYKVANNREKRGNGNSGSQPKPKRGSASRGPSKVPVGGTKRRRRRKQEEPEGDQDEKPDGDNLHPKGLIDDEDSSFDWGDVDPGWFKVDKLSDGTPVAATNSRTFLAALKEA